MAKNRERCLEHSRRRVKDLCRILAGEISSDSHEEGPAGPNFAMETADLVTRDLGKNLEVVFNPEYLVVSFTSLESKERNQSGPHRGIANFLAGGIPPTSCEDNSIESRGSMSVSEEEGARFPLGIHMQFMQFCYLIYPFQVLVRVFSGICL